MAVWKRNCLRKRDVFLFDQYHLDRVLRFGNGNLLSDHRLSMVHYDHRNPVRETVFQAGAAVADAVWCTGDLLLKVR